MKPWLSLSVQSGIDVLFRRSSRDAVYAPPGIRLIRGNGQDSNFIAALSYLKAAWRPADHYEMTASYVHGSVGSLVNAQGGRAAIHGLIQLMLRL